MKAHCKAHSIMYEKTMPDSPSQNGVAECANHTICSMACAMLIDTNLCDFFWLFAVLAATHIKQRVPHTSLPPNTTPFELWFHHRANISHLQPFRSHYTAHITNDNLSKFDARGESGWFLGYAKDAKGYLIWVPNQNNNSRTLKVRWEVVFHDTHTQSTSPPVPPHYTPLWEAINFPDCVTVSSDENTYVHAQQNTLSMSLTSKLSHSRENNELGQTGSPPRGTSHPKQYP